MLLLIIGSKNDVHKEKADLLVFFSDRNHIKLID